MRKMILMVLLQFSFIGAFGQQLLWATAEGNEDNLSFEEATFKVLEFYDLYNYYYDETGYSKEAFLEKFPDNKELISGLNELEGKAMAALRMHIEGGSAVLVMYVDENNIHLIIFSNVYMPNNISTYNGEMVRDRKRFEKWFGTLLD